MQISRRRTLGSLVAMSLGTPLLARAQAKPVRVVVPWNAGAAADVLTRAICQSISRTSGRAFVVDNRPGAGGRIGTQAVANAAPDGLTLLMSNADTHALAPFIYKNLPYDASRSFVPVTLFASVPFALIAGPSRPDIDSTNAFVASAKAAPRAISFASWGQGSTSHVGMVLLARALGIELNHIAFQGQTPGLLAVEGGHVDTMLLTAGGADAAAKAARVKLLGVAADKRLELMPAVPTLRELGINQSVGNWFALHAPAGTPPDMAREISGLVADAMRDPAVRDTYRLQAAVPEVHGPEALGKFVLSEQERWGSVIQAAGITLD
ncbi:tripartite tricarboxylate transporter substrate binding protein [Xylophilus sp. GOD-11R]|uniref:Bug family tripartite tricarboxylate transporter substrate binding protein n=1 Tax=Xylophilus sp. GOD-11R TaxID=3089814 RepID=UPI00298CDA57|nr:tripartite tricarboxylate transporter substrate binding protein [Xylophilus sp. GOD-11R]WPB55499.1 tripartite tricarboxylate transporter substrate binding protein [Xylophilus sp. GOD-11R]